MKIVKAGEWFRWTVNTYYMRITRVEQHMIYYDWRAHADSKVMDDNGSMGIKQLLREMKYKSLEHIPKIEAICLKLIK